MHKVQEVSLRDCGPTECQEPGTDRKDFGHTSFIAENADRLVENRKVANRIENVREKAIAYHDTVAPMLESIRYHVDKLELIVDDEMWPLPKYRELLFIR